MHLSHSTPKYGPHFVLSSIDSNIQANINISDPPTSESSVPNREQDRLLQYSHLVWTLVYALWGKLADDPLAVFSDNSESIKSALSVNVVDAMGERLSPHMLRKLLVSRWLSQALLVDAEDSVKVRTSIVAFVWLIFLQ